MREEVILAIDQGTTGTKAILLNREGKVLGEGYRTHRQIYPQPGWVEHDPLDIWAQVKNAVSDALKAAAVDPAQVAAVGLDNQGETVMVWDGESGNPLHNAVVWSCRRTQDLAEAWEKEPGWNAKVQERTGLRIDPYFSATKIRWLLDHAPGVGGALRAGSLLAGTMDAWLIWLMSGKKVHVTDPSTAARTLLFDIHQNRWDREIIDYLRIPFKILPKVRPSAGEFAVTDPAAFLGIKAPVLASLVDQPASLFGHLCLEPGSAKCTYGTGCFLLMNTGDRPVSSSHGLLSTVVWHKDGRSTYALDGGVYSAGSAVNWLVEIGLIKEARETGPLAQSVEESTVVFVPALTGMAAPYWDSNARGSFLGLTPAADRADLARAVLEGVAHRVADVVETMGAELGRPLPYLRVDGGMTKNDFLMQFQAEVLGVPVEVSAYADTTALGAGLLAGQALGWWTRPEELELAHPPVKTFEPRLGEPTRRSLRRRWREAVQATRSFKF